MLSDFRKDPTGGTGCTSIPFIGIYQKYIDLTVAGTLTIFIIHIQMPAHFNRSLVMGGCLKHTRHA